MPSGNGQPRTYSISGDTANGSLNVDLLSLQINADVSITSALDYINTNVDNMDIYFASTLSAGEITELDSLVAAHDGYTTYTKFQRWANQTTDSTTSESWVSTLQRTPDPLQGGYYEVAWNIELRLNPTGPVNSRAQARFQVDGTYVGMTNTVSDDWQAFSGWDIKPYSEGAQPVMIIEFQRDPVVAGNDTVEIRRVRMSIKYIDALDSQ